MKPDKSIMPAIIVGIALAGFYIWGSVVLAAVLYMMYKQSGVADPKLLSILDMFIIAGIGLTTGGVGYWLGNTHADANKDLMLHNSTPSPVPTEQVVRSVTTSTSTQQPDTEGKT